MVGLVPLFDPPRHDTRDTIERCNDVRAARLWVQQAFWVAHPPTTRSSGVQCTPVFPGNACTRAAGGTVERRRKDEGRVLASLGATRSSLTAVSSFSLSCTCAAGHLCQDDHRRPAADWKGDGQAAGVSATPSKCVILMSVPAGVAPARCPVLACMYACIGGCWLARKAAKQLGWEASNRVPLPLPLPHTDLALAGADVCGHNRGTWEGLVRLA